MTPNKAAEFLNSLLSVDDRCITSLTNNRVPCNDKLAKHPSVQVTTQGSGYLVGMLGIINGLFGVDDKGRGFINAVYNGDGELLFFDAQD